MLREMNHRVKNLFAIIGGMISAAARTHRDVDVLSADLRDRIASLGRAHSLASPLDGQDSTNLRNLVETTLQPYRESASIAVEGETRLVRWRSVSPLALILHEWATNSVKYGALGSGGRLAVRWDPRGDGCELQWDEEFPHRDHSPDGGGFGTLLVATSARQIGATIERMGEPTRYRLALRLPGTVFADD
jgi:two-component system, chemotaxis family, CheB/CheR fusion protein